MQFTSATEHNVLASEPLAWATQPTVVADTATANATATAVTDATTSTAAVTAHSVHKYELHAGTVLNTDVTMDNVLFSIATALYARHRTSSRCATVRQVDVYCNPVTQARYDAKSFMAQLAQPMYTAS
jgi:hypothetical protein